MNFLDYLYLSHFSKAILPPFSSAKVACSPSISDRWKLVCVEMCSPQPPEKKGGVQLLDPQSSVGQCLVMQNLAWSLLFKDFGCKQESFKILEGNLLVHVSSAMWWLCTSIHGLVLYPLEQNQTALHFSKLAGHCFWHLHFQFYVFP